MRTSLPAAVLAALPLLASAAPHGFTAADLMSLARLSQPALSPDGQVLRDLHYAQALIKWFAQQCPCAPGV